MFKWISGYLETLYLMSRKSNREHLRKSISQMERGETTSFRIRNRDALWYIKMLNGTEIDLEANCAYVRIHECKVDKTIEFEIDNYVDICSDGEVVGVEIIDLKSVLSAPLSAGADVEEWHSDIEEAVLVSRSLVLQDLMKSGIYDHRPIHNFY
jgi:uncharacterized protein YuzE